jgi:hypothetical protein
MTEFGSTLGRIPAHSCQSQVYNQPLLPCNGRGGGEMELSPASRLPPWKEHPVPVRYLDTLRGQDSPFGTQDFGPFPGCSAGRPIKSLGGKEHVRGEHLPTERTLRGSISNGNLDRVEIGKCFQRSRTHRRHSLGSSHRPLPLTSTSETSDVAWAPPFPRHKFDKNRQESPNNSSPMLQSDEAASICYHPLRLRAPSSHVNLHSANGTPP